MKRYSNFQLILILTPFVFSFALGLDIYIPLVPQISEIFQTTPSWVQLTLSLFLWVTGIGQLFMGPLSDRFGRRPLLAFSAILYAIGALLCIVSPSIGWLITSRVVSALGACGLLVTSFALVRDLVSKDESAKLYSFLNGAIGVSPTFAPIIGGYLGYYFGWKSVFFGLFIVGIFSLWVIKRFVKETNPRLMMPQPKTFCSTNYMDDVKFILKNKQLMSYSLLSGFAEAIFFCFFSLSPFIIMGVHKVPTQEFGYYFALFGLVIALGGFLSGKLVEWFGSEKTLAWGLYLMLGGGTLMLAWNFYGEATLTSFLMPVVISCTGSMFVVSCSASKALEPFKDLAGTASSLFGAMQFSMSAIAGSILVLISTTNVIPFAVFIIVMSCISFFTLMISKQEKEQHLNQASE